MKVVVAGAVAQRAGVAGHAWVFVQYLVGLRDLGHEVVFVDRLVEGEAHDTSYLHRELQSLGESIPTVALDGTEDARMNVARHLRSCAALLNVMGFIDDEELLALAPLRVFLDIDPGFPQMWRELGMADILQGHDAFVTVGENIGTPQCSIPTCGVDWIPTRPPVVLRHWPVCDAPPGGRFTTVCTWRGPFAPLDYRGQSYGLRVHEFRRFLPLPSRALPEFELALSIDASDRRDITLLEEHGWHLRDPATVAAHVTSYRDYIQASRGELMVAKNMYVATKSGWCSDRSVCYLATGRPVLAQDTGGVLSDVPAGVVSFSDLESAACGIARLEADHEVHCRTAREIAVDLFDARRVLPALLDRLGLR